MRLRERFMETIDGGKVLVTSGPTRAYIDRIRFVSNTSTGVIGARIIETLVGRHIPVVHVRGYGAAEPGVADSSLLESIEVVTVDDLVETMEQVAVQGEVRAVVHAMAVLDYVPESRMQGKIPSGQDSWTIRLIRTPKVIARMRELLPEAFFTGFKLEAGVTEKELVERAGFLLDSHRLDCVVANDLDLVNDVMHEALFVAPGNTVIARAHTKREIAEILTGLIMERLG